MSTLLEDARVGLAATPKRMPPVWFYDETGSHLFEAITTTQEYYLTETERAILRTHAEDILEQLRLPTRVAELGAGSATKTRVLLDALLARQPHVRFSPIDVSAEALRLSGEQLAQACPRVRVEPMEARNRAGVARLDWAASESWLVLFLGSSIGNLEPAEATGWLRDVTRAFRPGDTLLLGVDRHKPKAVVERAYNDAKGVTAQFNLNLLARMNRELGAAFDLGAFAHEAFYDEREHRVEMHLRSLRRQEVRIPGIGIVRFAEGETLHTENSYKYTDDMLRTLLERAGLREKARFADTRAWFNVLLLERAR